VNDKKIIVSEVIEMAWCDKIFFDDICKLVVFNRYMHYQTDDKKTQTITRFSTPSFSIIKTRTVMSNIRLILGNQLSESISSLKGCNKDKDVILICEVWDEVKYCYKKFRDNKGRR